MKTDLTIKPKNGLGLIEFGAIPEKVEELLGEPTQVEVISDSEDEADTTVWEYHEAGITAFFEGANNQVLSCIEIEHPNAELFGKKILGLNEESVIALMKENGYKELETEDEEWGERRVSFEDGLIDFIYSEGNMLAVNYGVLVNEDGEVVELD